MAKQIRHFFLNLLMLVFSVGIALILSEIIIRFIHPQQLIVIRPDIWCPHSGLGWKHCPQVSTRINTGEGEISFHSDGNGFRLDPQNQPVAPKARILVLGDSFMEAMQVNDGETTAERLKGLLESEHGSSVEVVNAGVAQWDPNHYLIQSKQALQAGKFDLGLIFIFLGNDIVDRKISHFPPRPPTLRHEAKFEVGSLKKFLLDSVLYPLNDFLRAKSHLFVFTKKSLETLLMRLKISGHYITPIFYKSYAHDPSWQTTADVAFEIAQTFDVRGIPSLFVFIPTSYQLSQEEFTKLIRSYGIDPEAVDLKQPNRILAEKMTQKGLKVLDPLENFRDLHKSGQKLYGDIDNHLNRQGHDALARQILPAVSEILGDKLNP